ncbi:hypothetical protein A7U60_g4099 [Sanghuangporus baumii]|uniref:RING-type E3 ubiquitin transferase n=1 Tax=Sanghuangporus baumii TaxID=108892 RepID=A0A9Q5HZ79_SANBA|nr:hypothetical protein A7U60_g4099 [Sanghuangporus baumii]
MEPDIRRSLQSNSPAPSVSSLRRRPSASTIRSTARPASRAESRQSDETAPISDSAFQTPDPGVSAFSLPPLASPTSADVPEHDDLRQPEQTQPRQRQQLRDSGIDSSTSLNRISNRNSQSMPNLPPLMPQGEDRPDLWQNELRPPTFRPRTRSRDAIAQGVATNHLAGMGFFDDTRDPPPPRQHGIRRVLAFLGFGTSDRHRRELVGLVWNLGFGFVQIVVTLGIIIYSSVHHSPQQPSVSEWTACDKPLGLWSCFWIVKVLFDSGMTYWSWRRDWKGSRRRQNRPEGDAEQGATPAPADVPSGVIPDGRAPVDTNLDPPAIGTVERQRLRIDAGSPLYSRLSLLLSLIIISWFLTSNILVFTSLHTCRLAAPHLWWLVFSFLCLQYLVILEVLATAIIVFIIGPLIFLFWSIILICLGRHPIQNPHYISPEVDKVSKSVVDQIPLVLYIPTPPGEDEKKEGVTGSGMTTPKPEPVSRRKQGAEHTYPPKQPPVKRRFAFLGRRSSKSASGSESAGKAGATGGIDNEKTAEVWEDCWESGEFPFVRLNPNRASCAICLLDFEEPKRRVARDVIRSWAQKNKERLSSEEQGKQDGGSESADGRKSEDKKQEDETRNADSDSDANANAAGASSSSNQSPLPSTPSQPEARRETSNRPSSDEDEDDLSIRLEDAGEGAQPLRLLPCGHAFHKTCIDPWLTGVSGRCPTCQRPILPPDPPKKKRSDRNPARPPPTP